MIRILPALPFIVILTGVASCSDEPADLGGREIVSGTAAASPLTPVPSARPDGPVVDPNTVPTPPERACLGAVAQAAGTDVVRVISSEFGANGTRVIVGAGGGSTPWRCIGTLEGATSGVAPVD